MAELNSGPETVETCIFCLIADDKDKETEVIKKVRSFKLKKEPSCLQRKAHHGERTYMRKAVTLVYQTLWVK